MPLPTQNDVHVDSLLTGASIGYTNPNFIADDIFPRLGTKKRSGLVPKFSKDYWFRNNMKLRAPGSTSVEAGWALDNTDTYYAHRYSLAHGIPDEVRDNQDDPYNQEQESVKFLSEQAMMNRDITFAAAHFVTGVWTTNKTVADFTVWSNYAGSTPIVNVDEYKNDVEALVGREPNVIAMGAQVWLQLKNHPDLLDLVKYSGSSGQPAKITAQAASALFAVDKLLIGKGLYVSAGNEGATGTISRIWGKNVIGVYVPPSPSLMAPAAGYCITWERVPNSLQYVVRFRDGRKETDFLEINSYFQYKQTEAGAGFGMIGVVS